MTLQRSFGLCDLPFRFPFGNDDDFCGSLKLRSLSLLRFTLPLRPLHLHLFSLALSRLDALSMAGSFHFAEENEGHETARPVFRHVAWPFMYE